MAGAIQITRKQNFTDNMNKVILCALGLVFDVMASSAQTNFTGKWTINKGKTDFGQVPQWVIPMSFVITQAFQTITITSNSFKEDNTPFDFTEKLVPADTSTIQTLTHHILKSFICWDTKRNTFAVISESRHEDGSLSSTANASWSITDNGKTLIVNRSVRQANGLQYELKTFYDKQ